MEWLVVLGGLTFYFFPAIMGWDKRNFAAIFALNLLLGWTVIGWIVALIWGLTNDPPTTEMKPPS